MIRMRNPLFRFDDNLNGRMLLQFIWVNALCLFRGLRLWFYFRKSQWAMLGAGVRFFYLPGIVFGRFLKVGPQAYISALGTGRITIGNHVSIGAFTRVIISTSLNQLGSYIQIGDRVGIGEFSYLGGAGGLSIGDDCIIGQYLSCHPENHIYDDPENLIRLQGVRRQGIVIGKNCWIGSKVTILDGVVIGDGCVLASGSVVTKSFAAGSVIGGVPARRLKTRNGFTA